MENVFIGFCVVVIVEIGPECESTGSLQMLRSLGSVNLLQIRLSGISCSTGLNGLEIMKSNAFIV